MLPQQNAGLFRVLAGPLKRSALCLGCLELLLSASRLLTVFGTLLPHYNLFILLLGPTIALGLWLLLNRTRAGRVIRAAALDREMLGALGVNVSWLYTGVFMLGSFLGGLGGALVTPVRAIVPGMDVEIIVEAFIVVVIGGLGSLRGTAIAAVVVGLVQQYANYYASSGLGDLSVVLLLGLVLLARPGGLSRSFA